MARKRKVTLPDSYPRVTDSTLEDSGIAYGFESITDDNRGQNRLLKPFPTFETEQPLSEQRSYSRGVPAIYQEPKRMSLDKQEEKKDNSIFLADFNSTAEVKPTDYGVPDVVTRHVVEKNDIARGFYHNNVLFKTSIQDQAKSHFLSAMKGAASNVSNTIQQAAIKGVQIATKFNETESLVHNIVHNKDLNNNFKTEALISLAKSGAMQSVLKGEAPAKSLIKTAPDVVRFYQDNIRNNPEIFQKLENQYNTLQHYSQRLNEALGYNRGFTDTGAYVVGEIGGSVVLSAIGFYGKMAGVIPAVYGGAAANASLDEARSLGMSFSEAYDKSNVVGAWQGLSEAAGISLVRHGMATKKIIYGKNSQNVFKQFLTNYKTATMRETSQEMIQEAGDFAIRKAFGMTEDTIMDAVTDVGLAMLISPFVVAPFAFTESAAKVKLSKKFRKLGLSEDIAVRLSEAAVLDGVELASNKDFAEIVQSSIDATLNDNTFDRSNLAELKDAIAKQPVSEEFKLQRDEMHKRISDFNEEIKSNGIDQTGNIATWLNNNADIINYFRSPEGFTQLKEDLVTAHRDIYDEFIGTGMPEAQAKVNASIAANILKVGFSAFGMHPSVSKALLVPKIINYDRLFMYETGYRNNPVVPSDIVFNVKGNKKDFAVEYLASMSSVENYKSFIKNNSSNLTDFDTAANSEYSYINVEAQNEQMIREQMTGYEGLKESDFALIAAMKRLGATETEIYTNFVGVKPNVSEEALNYLYTESRTEVIPELTADEYSSAKAAKNFLSAVNTRPNMPSGVYSKKHNAIALPNPKLTTLSHEMFHSFYFLLNTANDLASDYNTVNKDIKKILSIFDEYYNQTLKAKPIEDGKVKTNKSETLAVAFEQFLRTGEAPTPELTEAFNSFNAWHETLGMLTGYDTYDIDPTPVGNSALYTEIQNVDLQAANALRQAIQEQTTDNVNAAIDSLSQSNHKDALSFSYEIGIFGNNPFIQKLMLAKAEMELRVKALADSSFGKIEKDIEQPNPSDINIDSKIEQPTEGKVYEFIRKSGQVLSSTLKSVSPQLHRKIERNFYDRGQLLSTFKKSSKALISKINSSQITLEERAALDLALLNSNVALQDELAAKYDFQAELEDTRLTIESAYSILETANPSIGYIKNYWARKIIDYEGLMNHLSGVKEFNDYRSAVDPDNTMPMQELLDGFSGFFAKPKDHIYKMSNLSSRKIQLLDSAMAKFYAKPFDALDTYFGEVADVWAIIDMFGPKGREILNMAKENQADTKSYEKIQKDSGNPDIAGGSLYKARQKNFDRILKDLGYYEGLDEIKRKKLRDSLEALYFRTPAGVFDSVYRTVGSIVYLGNFLAAISQIGDFVLTSYKNGFKNTAITAAKMVNEDISGKKHKIDIDDLGITDLFYEFKEQKGLLKKGFDFVFNWSGFSYLDKMAKNTAINTSFEVWHGDLSMQASNKNHVLSDATGKMLETAMLVAEGDQARFEQIKDDIINQNFTDDVKYLLFSTLSEQQPINELEVPAYYNRYPNARLMYQFKTFGVKQINFLRDQIIADFKNDPKKGIKNLFRFGLLLMMAGVTKDVIRDLIKGKDVNLTDSAVFSIAEFFFVNKYVSSKYNKEGLLSGALAMIAPPVPLVDNAVKDIKNVSDGTRTVGEIRSARSIPLVGELYYWWFGGGAKYNARKNAKKKEPKGLWGAIKSLFS